MIVYVARHGQSEWNAMRKLSGRTDVPLSPAGREEARALAEQCARLSLDRIFTSPLLRARETAQIVASACALPLCVEPRLIEQNFGDWEGKPLSLYVDMRAQLAFRFPNGESGLDVAARVYPFLDELKLPPHSERVLLVCHGAVGRIVASYFRSFTSEAFSALAVSDNASLVSYSLD